MSGKRHTKFQLKCEACGETRHSLLEWFQNHQKCPSCGKDEGSIEFPSVSHSLAKLVSEADLSRKGLWRYFALLPIDFSQSIISAGEGDVPIDRWQFLEEYAARRYGIACRVYAHRQDNNYPTGSFKDLAGSLVASALKENRIYGYVIASTGNIGVAYSRYISNYGGRLYVFMPEKCAEYKYSEIAMFSQKVFRVKGDYDLAKTMSVESMPFP
jgi:threonine synthase